MDLNTIIKFLADLRFNNNRSWFKENNGRYQDAKAEFEQLIDTIIPLLKQVDDSIDIVSAKECVFRLFRDVRFSNNKEPYKRNFGAYISRGGRKSPYAGYYIHIEPGKSFIGGGIYMPEANILRAIRKEIYENTEEYKQIINNSSFKKYFPEIFGEKLKMAPKGFPKDFEDIDLLRNKHYAAAYSVKDAFWSESELFENMMNIFLVQYPFNRFLNEAVAKYISQ
ncbi:MAG TPA: TIGR02453 family protein [Bacteroidales bacterium]|nr:TIGR02453 family protein [Bacteroidales bacterium]